jgi:hypothetical protein
MNPFTPIFFWLVAAPSDLTEPSGRPWCGIKDGYDKLWGVGLERLVDKLLLRWGMSTFKMTIINENEYNKAKLDVHGR